MNWLDALNLVRQLQLIGKRAKKQPNKPVAINLALDTGGGEWVLNSDGLTWVPEER